jgi:hypothetical protein
MFMGIREMYHAEGLLKYLRIKLIECNSDKNRTNYYSESDA